MNNKGFTLIELLATIAIIGLVLGIASNSVLSSIKTSKKRSEKLFVEKTGKTIEEYISLHGGELSITSESISFDKIYSGYNKQNKTKETVIVNELSSIELGKLIDDGLIHIDKFINPANKEKCLVGSEDSYEKNPQIRVWKDSDYVYYYYVDLSENNTSCNISKENGIISTIPANLCVKIHNASYDTEKDKCIIE